MANNTATHSRNRMAEEEARREAERAEEAGELESSIQGYLRGRKQARLIKVGEETDKARSIDDAVVKTTKGLPDMRFAENRNRFMRDTAAKMNGRPDSRFVENRPDIMELHIQRGDDKPNLIFSDDGEME